MPVKIELVTLTQQTSRQYRSTPTSHTPTASSPVDTRHVLRCGKRVQAFTTAFARSIGNYSLMDVASGVVVVYKARTCVERWIRRAATKMPFSIRRRPRWPSYPLTIGNRKKKASWDIDERSRFPCSILKCYVSFSLRNDTTHPTTNKRCFVDTSRSIVLIGNRTKNTSSGK